MSFLGKIFSPIEKTLRFFSEHFKGALFFLLLFLIFSPNEEEQTPYNLQKITLHGAIMDVSETLAQIEKATNNPQIKGVLLEVNSPGGAVAPSIELSYAIKQLQKKKPVVVYASGTLASGSYYASIWAEKIVANPGSMVGSIGVVLEGADVSELMSKIGVKTQTIQAGKYKRVGTTSRAWKPYEVNELNKVIQDTYALFSEDVAKARKLKLSQKNSWANAHIFTARQAQKIGLVDIVGVEYDAKKILKGLSHVAKASWNKPDPFEKFVKKLSAATAVTLSTYFPTLTLR